MEIEVLGSFVSRVSIVIVPSPQPDFSDLTSCRTLPCIAGKA